MFRTFRERFFPSQKENWSPLGDEKHFPWSFSFPCSPPRSARHLLLLSSPSPHSDFAAIHWTPSPLFSQGLGTCCPSAYTADPWTTQGLGCQPFMVENLCVTLMLGKTKGRRRRGRQRWDGWMASLTRWTWVWARSGSCWWTGKPGMLWSMGLQRVRHNWVTELNWTYIQPSIFMVLLYLQFCIHGFNQPQIL